MDNLERESADHKKAEKNVRDTSSFMQTLIDAIPCPIFYKDANGKYLGCNKYFEVFIGMGKEEIIGKTVFDLAPADLAHKYHAMDSALFLQNGKQIYESQVLYADGSRHDVIFNKAAFLNSDGSPAGLVGVIIDITERKQAEERIVQQNDFLNTVLESLPHPFYVLDVDNYTVKMANSAAAPAGLQPNTTCYALTHKETSPCLGPSHVCPIETIKRTREPMITEHIHYDKDGNTLHVEVHAHPIFNSSGDIVQVIEYSLDITERKLAEERIRHLALHDFLTDLPNRNLLFDRISQAIALAHRYQHMAAILYIDLDGFKTINDTFGHKFGDSVLIETANRLRKCIRETDTVARLGGDEFAVILQDLQEKQPIEEIAHKIVQSLAKPFVHNGRSCLLRGVSIGISMYPVDAKDTDTLLQKADQAMYRVKKSGKGGYFFCDQQS
jgi:diguanylate cyclase (GGDEF)-like protein/PAS domain S-box-containing protein